MSGAHVAQDRMMRGWEDAPKGLRWRILVSVLGPIAWVCLTLLYVGFWSSGFTVVQSLIVVLVSTLVMAGVITALWIGWGPRYRHAFD